MQGWWLTRTISFETIFVKLRLDLQTIDNEMVVHETISPETV
jgi:hypothetical protein